MFSVSAELNTPGRFAWRLLTDTRAWPRWGPSVRDVETPQRVIGPGATGRVRTAAGIWLPFAVTEWEDGAWWAWKVAGIPATGHGVTPLGPDRCRVKFTVPAWAPWYLPVCRRALDRLAALAEDSLED
ncbi:MAG: SRPBCC family protein [Gammaproteobacteria bacterium]